MAPARSVYGNFTGITTEVSKSNGPHTFRVWKEKAAERAGGTIFLQSHTSSRLRRPLSTGTVKLCSNFLIYIIKMIYVCVYMKICLATIQVCV